MRRPLVGSVFAVPGVIAAVVAGRHRPMLGICFFVTIFVALSLNGMRGTLSSLASALREPGASPAQAAAFRTVQRLKLGTLILLTAGSTLFAVAAARSDGVTRIFATGFAVAALCAGPLTSVRRRVALGAAAGIVLLTLLSAFLFGRTV